MCWLSGVGGVEQHGCCEWATSSSVGDPCVRSVVPPCPGECVVRGRSSTPRWWSRRTGRSRRPRCRTGWCWPGRSRGRARSRPRWRRSLRARTRRWRWRGRARCLPQCWRGPRRPMRGRGRGSIWWSTRRGTASSAHCSTPADSDPFDTLKCDEPEKPRSYALLRRRVTDWPAPSGRPQRADDEGNLERKTKQPLPIRVEAEAVTFVPPLRHIAREDCYEEGCDHTANHALPSSTEKGRAECDFSDAGSKDGRVFADRDPGRHLCAELFTSGCQVGDTGVGKG